MIRLNCSEHNPVSILATLIKPWGKMRICFYHPHCCLTNNNNVQNLGYSGFSNSYTLMAIRWLDGIHLLTMALVSDRLSLSVILQSRLEIGLSHKKSSDWWLAAWLFCPNESTYCCTTVTCCCTKRRQMSFHLSFESQQRCFSSY